MTYEITNPRPDQIKHLKEMFEVEKIDSQTFNVTADHPDAVDALADYLEEEGLEHRCI